MDNINEELTGHSARRSGAMWYARKGLPVHEIGLLGRWKSSAVFRYIEEALQEIPLNTNVMATTTGAQDRQMICPGTPVPGTPVANVAKFQEVQEDKEPAPQTRKAKKPAPPEQCWAVSTGRKGRTSHRVRRASWNLSLASWDTWCGWHFAEKNVKVTLSPKLLASTSQCKRCEAAYQSRDGVKDEVSLASLVNFDWPMEGSKLTWHKSCKDRLHWSSYHLPSKINARHCTWRVGGIAVTWRCCLCVSNRNTEQLRNHCLGGRVGCDRRHGSNVPRSWQIFLLPTPTHPGRRNNARVWWGELGVPGQFWLTHGRVKADMTQVMQRQAALEQLPPSEQNQCTTLHLEGGRDRCDVTMLFESCKLNFSMSAWHTAAVYSSYIS